MPVDLALLQALRNVPVYLDAIVNDLEVCTDAVRRSSPHVIKADDYERLVNVSTELRTIRYLIAQQLQRLR